MSPSKGLPSGHRGNVIIQNKWRTFPCNGISPLNPQKSLTVGARAGSKLGSGFRLEMKSRTALNLLGNFPLWNDSCMTSWKKPSSTIFLYWKRLNRIFQLSKWISCKASLNNILPSSMTSVRNCWISIPTMFI